MPLADSITSLANDTLTIRRRPKGTWEHGKYVRAAGSTFTAPVVMQPAFNMNRVIGGSDMRGMVDNERVSEVMLFYTLTEIRTLTDNHDADEIENFRGDTWTVIRVEPWPDLDGGFYYKVLITRHTEGAA